MLDVEARSAKFADERRNLDGVAELDRHEKAGTRVDQRDAGDVMEREQFRARHAERGFEQLPGAGIEKFEETAVEYDAGRIAGAPLDRETPAVDKSGHRNASGTRRSPTRSIEWRLLSRLPEIAQVGRPLALLGRHQQTLGAEKIRILTDDDVHVADAADVLHELGVVREAIGLVD